MQVSGEWRSIAIVRENGFYLDLLGVARTELGQVEATLEDGTVHLHQIATNVPIR